MNSKQEKFCSQKSKKYTHLSQMLIIKSSSTALWSGFIKAVAAKSNNQNGVKFKVRESFVVVCVTTQRLKVRLRQRNMFAQLINIILQLCQAGKVLSCRSSSCSKCLQPGTFTLFPKVVDPN